MLQKIFIDFFFIQNLFSQLLVFSFVSEFFFLTFFFASAFYFSQLLFFCFRKTFSGSAFTNPEFFLQFLGRVKPKANKGLHNQTFSKCKRPARLLFLFLKLQWYPTGIKGEKTVKMQGFPLTDCAPDQRAIFVWKCPQKTAKAKCSLCLRNEYSCLGLVITNWNRRF